MAESTLTSTYEDLRVVAGLEMGWGRDPDTHWTATNDTDFGIACKEGYRNFLYPVSLPGENKSHNWSFLYPSATLQLYGTYDLGTVVVGADADTDPPNYDLTLVTDASFPVTAVGGTVTFTLAGTTYTAEIITRTSSLIAVARCASNVSGVSTTNTATYLSYALPDDFGGMVSDSFTYHRAEQWHLPQIKIVGEAEIRKVDRSNSGDAYPRYASITPLSPVAQAGGTGATSTRWVVRFYPDAEQTYEVDYRYHAIPPALDEDTNIYHYGGAEHSQTIIAAVIDALYRRVHASNEKSEEFHNRLKQSILHDRRNYNTGNLGQRLNYTDGRSALRQFRESTPTGNITTTFY